ncbi:uncharacterized protein LOC144701385 isoform X1 [Wolffia australiana]
MTARMKGLLRGLRHLSNLFEAKEEREMQIGYPTDVKHVAHIGWDGAALNSPAWVCPSSSLVSPSLPPPRLTPLLRLAVGADEPVPRRRRGPGAAAAGSRRRRGGVASHPQDSPPAKAAGRGKLSATRRQGRRGRARRRAQEEGRGRGKREEGLVVQGRQVQGFGCAGGRRGDDAGLSSSSSSRLRQRLMRPPSLSFIPPTPPPPPPPGSLLAPCSSQVLPAA